MNKISIIVSIVTQVSCLAFFTGSIFSFRAVTSIGIGMMLMSRIIENRFDPAAILKPLKDPFVATSLLFFILQIISLAYTHNTAEGWSNIRLKSGLLFIPLAFYNTGQFEQDLKKRLIDYFYFILFIASFYCLIVAGWHYGQGHNITVFFYHTLVKPISQHAVYFSVFVFAALVLLLENMNRGMLLFNRALTIGMVLYFSILLFLLSSKLVIAFYLLYLLYYIMVLLRKNTESRLSVLALFATITVIACTALFMKNPVSKRFHEVLYSDMKLVNQDKFAPSDYFDGLQFRILQWKFVPGILTKNNSWWSGVSPGDAQSFLDKEYISKYMYTGDGKSNRGLLGYNTHNQFLESLLQTGIIGLLLFLLIIACFTRMAWKIRHTGYVFILLLLLAWLFSESVFETQYGILIFTFFPLFLTSPAPEVYPINQKSRQWVIFKTI